MPVTLSWVVAPAATDTVAGVTASDTCAGETISREAVPLIWPNFAVIVAWPTPWPVATPDKTVAISVADDHAANVLMSRVEPSLKVPIAE